MFITILILFYILITGFLLYMFYQNDYSIKKMLQAIKKNIFSCCIKNKKDAESKIGKKAVKEFQESGPCHFPKDLLLDICLKKDLNKDDMILRKKLKEIIKKIDTVVIDNGTPKQKIPLEATIFLTKNLAPLVDEEGNISISLRANESKDLINAINEALGTSFDYLDIESTKKGLAELKNSFSLSSTETMDEITKPKKELEATKQKKETPLKKPAIPDDLDIEDISEGLDFDKELEGLDFDKELEGLDFDKELEETNLDDTKTHLEEESSDAEANQDTIYDFYCDLPWKTLAKNVYFDATSLKDTIENAFSVNNAKEVFFNNLIKTQPLVFTQNKESFFAPKECVALAFFKMFGADYKTWLDFFRKTDKNTQTELFSTIFNELKDHMDNKKLNSSGISKVFQKKEAKFFAYGYIFETKSLKLSFSSKDYDFIRSYPFSKDFTFSENQGKENLPKLVSNFADAEIKC